MFHSLSGISSHCCRESLLWLNKEALKLSQELCSSFCMLRAIMLPFSSQYERVWCGHKIERWFWLHHFTNIHILDFLGIILFPQNWWLGHKEIKICAIESVIISFFMYISECSILQTLQRSVPVLKHDCLTECMFDVYVTQQVKWFNLRT